ncbi:MAG TPA: DUF488 domain-containing protein [Rhodocyclaceae bacterium]|nr:DUF488 domain-containing protein [Rhodocyclaceae bacterium]
MKIAIKRIYADAAPDDGQRVLIDRLWPRGIRRDDAAIDEWLREAAPSPALRRWFGHDPARWDEFRRRYRAELLAEPAATAVQHLRTLARRQPVTLLYAARDEVHNHAVVLREHLETD